VVTVPAMCDVVNSFFEERWKESVLPVYSRNGLTFGESMSLRLAKTIVLMTFAQLQLSEA